MAVTGTTHVKQSDDQDEAEIPSIPDSDSIRALSIDALLSVSGNEKAPAAARAAASRTLLEAIGVIGRNQDVSRMNENRSASEMTTAEIGEEIARLSQRLPPIKMRKVKL